jgi:response regulator RpfG family c-di-GMP phosphodiesterase
VAAVRHHHDRWDGVDHIDGMTGQSIPVPARILAVAERFEALTAGRGCTRATSQEALDQIVAVSGSEFDPVVVEALGRATREGGLELNLPDLALPATVAATA